jgi:hypothetical protein
MKFIDDANLFEFCLFHDPFSAIFDYIHDEREMMLKEEAVACVKVLCICLD